MAKIAVIPGHLVIKASGTFLAAVGMERTFANYTLQVVDL